MKRNHFPWAFAVLWNSLQACSALPLADAGLDGGVDAGVLRDGGTVQISSCYPTEFEHLRLRSPGGGSPERCFDLLVVRGATPNAKFPMFHSPPGYGLVDARYSTCAYGTRFQADGGLNPFFPQAEELVGELNWYAFGEFGDASVPIAMSIDGGLQVGDLYFRFDPAPVAMLFSCGR